MRSSFLLGSALGLGLACLMAGAVHAQDATPTPTPAACSECHLDVTGAWTASPHAHAFNDPNFQEGWQGNGQPGECLLCHTTGYQAGTGSYLAEGVTCEGCHGPASSAHPPAAAPLKADTEYCGTCHIPTLSEWRLTGHGAAGVGCMDCHDPHSQKALFAVADDMCLNCHKEEMGDYLENLHHQKDIGCVDCHALVIPPETPPQDGLVPTGHQFTITTQTCIACHTDTLHAGFSLPGYENGASADPPEQAVPESSPPTASADAVEAISAEQQVQMLEAALANRSLVELFQGGLVGLALGGTTAWLIAHNRSARREHGQPAAEAHAQE
jgi:predicted CXXCH cytochrome family protein